MTKKQAYASPKVKIMFTEDMDVIRTSADVDPTKSDNYNNVNIFKGIGGGF